MNTAGKKVSQCGEGNSILIQLEFIPLAKLTVNLTATNNPTIPEPLDNPHLFAYDEVCVCLCAFFFNDEHKFEHAKVGKQSPIDLYAEILLPVFFFVAIICVPQN